MRAADLWSQLLALKMLVVYHDATGDERIQNVVERGLRRLDFHIDTAPLSHWGQFRWFEGLISIWWLYERTGDEWLLDLAVKIHAQGFDWGAFFARWPLREPTPRGRWNYAGHVVNNAMAVKSGPLWWRLSGEEVDRRAAEEMIELLDRYHGSVTGVFTGDECLAGRSPVQGTELCAVVEYMYSLELLLSVLGESAFGDRLERRPSGAISIVRGPLVYALRIGEEWRRVNAEKEFRELPHGDWEVYPTTPWNFALKVGEASLAEDVEFAEGDVGETPFSPEGAPVSARVKGRRVPGWRAENGSAQEVPAVPECAEEAEELELIPYGCTNLRIAEFPVAG